MFGKELSRFISIVIMAVSYYGTDYLLKTYAPKISSGIRKTTACLIMLLVCVLLVCLEK